MTALNISHRDGQITDPGEGAFGSETRTRIVSKLLNGVLWASVLFNLILCFIDTNIVTLNQSAVIAAEVAILAAALALPFAFHARRLGRLDLLLILLLANWLFLSIIRQAADPKLFRDVAIIPIFVIAGMASRGARLHSMIFWLHMVIFLFALWEAISLQSFVSVFSIGDFFGHTRGHSNDEWWVDSGLYLSAVRPEERFLFPDLPLHRLSSVFLEPVSLGNYVIIATLWLTGFWRQIPRRMAIIAAVATVLLWIGSDSRMATITCVALLLAAAVKRWIPSVAPMLAAPIVIAAMFVASASFGLTAGTDDFGGRIAHSVGVFRDFQLEDFAGVSLGMIKGTEDAGFAYLINTQSLIVAMGIWAILFSRRLVTPESRYVHFAVALYLALNLTVSWSLFSIKTAGILWVLLGRAVRDDHCAQPPIGQVARSGWRVIGRAARLQPRGARSSSR